MPFRSRLILYLSTMRAIASLLVLGPLSFTLSAQTWEQVGSGASSTVYALEPFAGDLYAGGLFTEIGGVNTNYLARWNGSEWNSVNNLITYMSADGLYANDTALFIGDGGRVRFWNGTNMSNLTGNNSSSFNSTAYSLAHFQDTLYVGGFFSTPFARIAKWTGTGYESLTSGCSAQVSALTPFEGQLFVGGNFYTAGDSLVRHTALWNGSEWNRMGDGVNDDVFTQCMFQDTLYIGGRFTQANGLPASRVAKWNGSQWVKVGGTLNDYVTTMTIYHDQLYIGGAFTTPSYIARLYGNTWVPVGAGCNNKVQVMEVHNDSLFVGGEFTIAGGVPASRIAKWHLPQAPVANFTMGMNMICTNECTTFTDISPNGVTARTWSFTGGTPASSTDSVPTVCYALPGTYAVTLTVTNAGGSSSTSEVIVVDVCSGIANSSTGHFSILPNPAQNQIELRRSTGDFAIVRITDSAGREVSQVSFIGERTTIDVSALSAGMYLVVVEMGTSRMQQRLVIER